jgi:hypothetical protein
MVLNLEALMSPLLGKDGKLKFKRPDATDADAARYYKIAESHVSDGDIRGAAYLGRQVIAAIAQVPLDLPKESGRMSIEVVVADALLRAFRTGYASALQDADDAASTGATQPMEQVTLDEINEAGKLNRKPTATKIKELRANPHVASQVLYKLSKPIGYDDYGRKGETSYVVVSAADAPFSGPETYIFASDAEGNVHSYNELDGSFRGSLDHAKALKGAGYEVAR